MYKSKRYGSASRIKRRDDGYSPSPFKGSVGKGATKFGFDGSPAGEGEVKDHISAIALRDLPKSSYSVKASPTEAMLPGSEPYAILNRFNSGVNAEYAGEDNIDGGNVQQYANSPRSKFLRSFDYARMKINMNYRYLPIAAGTQVGRALVDEMRKSIAESVSILKSTTFTQLEINNYAVITDLNMGSATTKNVSPAGKPAVQAYTSTTDVLYAMSIFYQILLQDANSAFLWHNSFRMKQGTMIRTAWNREVPQLNSFFGLMNKSSFLNLLKSVSLSFEGEYFDQDFANQVADVSFIPSRRSNAMTDPLKEIQPEWNHPNIFVVIQLNEKGQLFNDDGTSYDDLVAANTIFDVADLTVVDPRDETKSLTIWEVFTVLRDYLSAQATVLWARDRYNAGDTDYQPERYRFNIINDLFSDIISMFTILKPRWAAYRECLDTMVRTGTLTWVNNYTPSVTDKTDMTVYQNFVVDNIYRSTMAGPNALEFDGKTKRWRGWTTWDMYSGIPAYDVRQGGFFIAASTKELSLSQPDGTLDGDLNFIPVAFTAWTGNQVKLALTSRDGYEAVVDYVVTAFNSGVRAIGRLAPLPSQASLEIRVPLLKWTTNSSLSGDHRDMLYKELCAMFGLCAVQFSDEGVNDWAVDPDLLAIYQIEYEDITNVAITYARANAPFRGTTSSAGILGFWGIRK